MAFVLMEDVGRPMPRRVTAVIRSVRIARPVWKLMRFTFRSSRFMWRTAMWVVLGDRPARQIEIPAPPSSERTQPERATDHP